MKARVILVEPENAGNLGAVARAMKNFRCKDLTLVNPKADALGDEAKARAMHGFPVLQKARVVDSLQEALRGVDVAVATSAKTQDRMQILRSPLPVRAFMARHRTTDSVYGFVFGCERIGLTNEQLKQCDLTLTIPADRAYPTLNLSHQPRNALYEAALARGTRVHKGFLRKRVKEELIQKWLDLIHCGEKIRNKDYALAVFKALLARTPLERKEARLLLGVFDSVLKRVGQFPGPKAALSERPGKPP
ncbi:MAG TPA: RNA methyltransferase [Candidatus Diapherotrites archaeon]|uniref:RNA methyltransferase n=1 Tax=Candidatus Iainarchaeum sp. TaxID=3101447 RepID=A0A7J4JH72_9ARCH|nr:RNA methyltransferase [Candidatus Diapherotrites archaeon]